MKTNSGKSCFTFRKEWVNIKLILNYNKLLSNKVEVNNS